MAVKKSGSTPKPAVNVNVIHADGKKWMSIIFTARIPPSSICNQSQST
ncbi:hypothetical protein [Methanobrevibacter sp.]